ncbi:MAG: tetratricopeptide repeat protein, partial [Methylophilaceae bacterium]|nr:tetratricopeptide repeat protein [Methylophilaceae bacterium]
DDVFGVEGEVAQTIAETLKARLTGAEAQQIAARPTANPAAYDAYLRGLAFNRRADALGPNILNAIAAYQQAVQLDPGFALAWAGLSKGHSFAYIYEDPSEAHHRAAREAAETAARLAPETAETRIAQGFYRYWVERDYEGAKTIFEAVRQQAPNDSWATYALAAIARRQGRWSDCRSLFDLAVALDPQNILLLVDSAGTDLAMRDVAAAQQLMGRALVVAPDNPGVLATQAGALQEIGAIDQAQAVLDRARTALGDDNLVFTAATNAALSRHFAPAIALLQSQLAHPESLGNSLAPYETALADLQRLAGDDAAAKASYMRALADVQAALKAEPDNARFVSTLSTIEAGLGHRDAALAQARQAIALLPAAKDAFVGPGYEENLARLQARFGERDAALAALRHLLAIAYGWPSVTPAMLRLDPDWDNLRGDPRFGQLLADATGLMEAQSRR